MVWGLLVGLLGVLVAPAFAVPDDEDSSLSYFDDDDDVFLWAIPETAKNSDEAVRYTITNNSGQTVGIGTWCLAGWHRTPRRFL